MNQEKITGHYWGRTLRSIVVMALDALWIVTAFFLALWLRFEFRIAAIPAVYFSNFRATILWWALASVAMLWLMGGYNCIWRYVGIRDLQRLLYGHGIMMVIGLVIIVMGNGTMPRSYYCMGFVLSVVGSLVLHVSYRVLLQVYAELFNRRPKSIDRVMIVGAGGAAQSLIREFSVNTRLNAKVECLVDDSPGKQRMYLEGVRVVGDRTAIPAAAKRYNIDRIVFAIPSATPEQRRDILQICSTTKCKIQVLPSLSQLVTEEVSVSQLKDVEVQDLLGREPIRVNVDNILQFIGGKVVMVTGGGGSIGSELCRQIAKSNPKLLLIFDVYENNLYDIQMELQRAYPELNLVALVGSVRNTARMESVLGEYKPDIVFHAAAHKHVPLMEDSPNEAIKNNVLGTYKTAIAAAKHGVKKFVLISTDKAVNPTNIMGASKRLCEMVVQMMNRRGTETDFVAVRFGNVLGSNGSVIPLFKKQIAEGGPVTVTHPDIIRYFMTIPEAVSLVLQASYYAKGGEIFILDMGEPVRIADMARNLIRLSGYEPDVDIKIVYTGLRPGEKLFEELLMKEEGLKSTDNHLIHIGRPIEMDDELFTQQLERLRHACESESEDIKDIVAEIVPTYHPQKAQ
ncbi:MAG: polysaccharide biosynthesis protein [Oscillospiraceae bacterium]|nr:polysaccharide biosynthesis protein [Oscillospiraceae bacterium]